MLCSLFDVAIKIRRAAQRTVLFGLTTIGFMSAASAQSICVFDPAGKAGDYYRLLDQYALEASSWGVSLDVKVYTDEETAVKDYEAKQ